MAFANEYVINEVQEMLSRLRSILDNPKAYFDKWIASKNRDNESHYLTVYNMNDQDNSTYKAYPHEMIDVFQAEKISGALDFLERISALKPIYEQAYAAADEIKEMAHKLVPQIEKNMRRIASDVKRLQEDEDALSIEIEALDRDIEPHIIKIDALYEKKCSEAHEGVAVYKSDIESEYSKNHVEYAGLITKRYERNNERSKVRNEKSERHSFYSRLEQCKKEIENDQAD